FKKKPIRMPKRGYNPSEEDSIPIVEKLYRENQESDFLGGGFCDDDDEVQERREQISEIRQKRADAAFSSQKAPDNCEKCDKELMDSWLWQRYNCPVCDACRDDKGEHKLLARTEVKNAYLLKDCDLDLRKPALRYWAKKNPHNPRYGDMKLYLKCQVEARVLEVHGSLEDLELKKELREQTKEVRSEKRFEKKLKDLRQQIRGTTGVKVDIGKHVHNFGPETHVKEDTWKKTCRTCDYEEVFEKL
uniref:XPA_C domain-containing protein n=2 Tax=Caenorhabditis japonica TaxID=281687 RepID=A0A8R1EM99_CAEJA